MGDSSQAPVARKDNIVGGKFRLIRKIGAGSFGDIYLGINMENGEVTWLIFKSSFTERLSQENFCFLLSFNNRRLQLKRRVLKFRTPN